MDKCFKYFKKKNFQIGVPRDISNERLVAGSHQNQWRKVLFGLIQKQKTSPFGFVAFREEKRCAGILSLISLLFLTSISFASFQPVSGSTVAVMNITNPMLIQSTSTINVAQQGNITINSPAVTQSGTWGVNINNPAAGVYTVSNSTNPLLIQSTNTINVSQQGNITINSPAVTQSGTWGVNINNPASGVYTVSNSTNPLLVQSTSTLTVQGTAASGATASGNPLQDGGIGRTAMPTAVTDGQAIALFLSKHGKMVIMDDCPRDLIISTSVTLSASTSETVLLSSGTSGVFNDLHILLVNNTSATAARIDFRSKGNNTAVDFPIYVPAGDIRGLATTAIWPQGTSAANWTVQSSASVTDIRIAASFCQNK